MQHKVIILLIIDLLITSGCDLNFEFKPSVLTIGSNKEISLECSTCTTGSESNTNITSVSLSRKQQKEEFEMLAYIEAPDDFVSTVNEKNMILKGHLKKMDRSFLKLRWTRPGLSDVGTYQCIVTGVDKNGIPFNINKTLNLNYEITKDMCVNAKGLNLLNGKILEKLNLNFFPPESFRGKKYFLSRNEAVGASAAIATCPEFNSYLIEVDDLEELKVAEALARKHGKNSVLLAGTDEKNEKDWIFPRTGKRMTFYNWDVNQPDNYQTGEHCIQMGFNPRNEKLNDYPCDRSIYFICESND